MLGGINNQLYFQGLSGFAVMIFFIFFLKWAFPSPHKKSEKKERKALKKSLRELKRK